MKNQIVLVFLLFAISGTQGQNSQPFVYGSISAGGGSHTAFQWSVETMIKQKHHFSFAYHSTQKNATDVPENYHGGISLHIFWDNNLPKTLCNTYAILYGRAVPTKSKMIRFVLDAGLGIAVTKKPVDFERIEKPERFGTNYTYSYEKTRNLSLVLEPKVEFPLSRFIGFSTGPVANINPKTSSYGWMFGLNFGLLRDKRHKKTLN